MEFYPFGFSLKDLQTWMTILRCYSVGDFYHIATRLQLGPSSPSSFASLSLASWHSRLGHYDVSILSALHQHHFISYNNNCDNFYHLVLLENKSNCILLHLYHLLISLFICIVTFGLFLFLVHIVIVITFYFLIILPIFYGHLLLFINLKFILFS